MKTVRSVAGFTLLEVMVSLAILAISLTALSGIHANSFNSSNYAKFVTVATLLARSKMIDVEEQLRKDGFSEEDKEYDGDFEKEGFANFKWVATSRKVEVDVGQLVGQFLGGDVKGEDLPETIATFVGAMRGEGDKDLVDQVGGSDLSKMLGGGQLEIIFKQVGDTLSKSIREITLEIRWSEAGEKDDKKMDSIKFVQYVVQGGRLSENLQRVGSQAGLPAGGIPGLPGGIGGPGSLTPSGVPVNPNAPLRFPVGPGGTQLPGQGNVLPNLRVQPGMTGGGSK